FVLFPVLFSMGMRGTTASHAALIFATLPLFTGLFASLLERRLPGRGWWLGVAIAFAGEFLLIHFRVGFQGGENTLTGDMLILAACLVSSLSYVAGGKLAQTYSPWGTTFWGLTFAGIMLLPALGMLGWEAPWGEVDFAGWVSILYLAIVSSILSYLAWFWALARGGIARVGVMQYLLPVATFVFAAIVLDEILTLPLFLSTAVILGGVYLAQRD
ncbi:MAG: DMT family transporter, partial [bacterium]